MGPSLGLGKREIVFQAILPHQSGGESKQVNPGEPSERPDRPDDIRPWMQLNHRAHPPTPDPCLLPVLRGTLRVPRRPGIQGNRPALEPMGPSEGAADAVPGPVRPPAVRAPSTQHTASARTVTLRRLWGGPLRLAHPRPPTLPFWAAALPRWASLNSPIAYLDYWAGNPATHPPYLLSSASPSIPMYLVPRPPLRNPSSPSLSPADLSSSLTYSLACSLTSSIPSNLSSCSPPATPPDPPCEERPATAHTQPVPTITARHPRVAHPLCKADRPPSLPTCPPTNKPFPPSNPDTNSLLEKYGG